MDATVGIATYGHNGWRDLAIERALPSAQAQGVPVIVHHGDGTLAEARNHVLEQCETEYLIYLDGDDQLEPNYVAEMMKGSADLRAPAIRQVQDPNALTKIHALDMGKAFVPKVFRHNHDCDASCLRYGNWLVIGTCVRTALLREVGGWEEWAWSEDWAMFARCWAAGGTVEAIPRAIYRAYTRSRSRNRSLSNRQIVNVHRDIEAAIWGESVDTKAHPARGES